MPRKRVEAEKITFNGKITIDMTNCEITIEPKENQALLSMFEPLCVKLETKFHWSPTMPVCVKKVSDKWRVVECSSGKIVKNDKGTAVDGGGHKSRAAAERQKNAINIHQGHYDE